MTLSARLVLPRTKSFVVRAPVLFNLWVGTAKSLSDRRVELEMKASKWDALSKASSSICACPTLALASIPTKQGGNFATKDSRASSCDDQSW
eukprot:2596789-Amphidinium_carterae.1